MCRKLLVLVSNLSVYLLELADGKWLQFVDSVKYLRLRVCVCNWSLTGRCFKYSFEEVKMKFFPVFNCIYATLKLLQLN